MVMEAPPTPQCVGREFVRQYYTLLNKAPAHLHRFYNNNSSFVHGGLDPPNRETKPMVGQRQIHQMIQRLNFRDCHAKISQVDSQATLGDGVVVQVTGELSNGGQPMRRFTQTFVLAAQSPKKYYVHNDIFRYQDMLVSDEDLDHDSGRSEAEEDVEQGDLSGPALQQPSQTQAYYPQPLPQQIIGGQPPLISHPVNGVLVHLDELANMVPVAPQAPVAQAPVQPVAQPLGPATQPAQPVQPVQPAQPPPAPVEDTVGVADESTESVAEHAESHADEQEEPDVLAGAQDEKVEATLNESFEEPASETAVRNEPKTYATLLKGCSQSAGPTVSMATKPSPTSPPPPQRPDQSSITSAPLGQRPGNGRPTRGGANVRGMGRPSMDGRQGRPPFGEDSDGERRRSGPNNSIASYPDNNQLFLGNLPLHATEDELKKLFSQYGPVADLRIHSKNNNLKGAGPPNTKVPNYGFITFEDPAAVKNVLEKRPILFDGHLKLNVEEKKPRSRNDTGGPRSGPGGEGSMMGRPGNPMGQRVGGPMGSVPRGGGGGGGGGSTGMRGGRMGGGFQRSEGGPGGQGGPRGNMNGNNRGPGGYVPRRQ